MLLKISGCTVLEDNNFASILKINKLFLNKDVENKLVEHIKKVVKKVWMPNITYVLLIPFPHLCKLAEKKEYKRQRKYGQQ